MPRKNPRPAMMESLSTLCKSMESRLKNLEAEAESLHRVPVRRGQGAPAAQALLDEVKELDRDITDTLDTVREQSGNLGSFLEGMKVQMQELVGETSTMEQFMAQYGWVDKQPIDLDSLDWSKAPAPASPPEVTPASAAEFPESETEPAEEPKAATASMTSSATASMTSSATTSMASSATASSPPSLFDIGLSEATLKLIIAKNRPQVPKPATDSLVPPVPTIGPPPPPTSSLLAPPPPFSIVSKSNNFGTSDEPTNSTVEQSNYFDDTNVGASPFLMMRSKLDSLPPVSDVSLTQSFAAGLEISPGLPRRMVVNPGVNPGNLDVTNVASPIMSNRRFQQFSACISPESPTLQTVNIRNLISSSQAPQVQGAKATPEEPILSEQYKRLAAASPGAETRVTPEVPAMSQHQERVLSRSPETPILKTVDLKKMK